jgi:replicative superfamily II helicase
MLTLHYVGAQDCAIAVLSASSTNIRPSTYFLRSPQQQQALADAADQCTDKALKAALVLGVAWHHAAMEPGDRSLVEQMFISRNVMFLAATATLAQVLYPAAPGIQVHVC